jgi:AcrR family transcriptional regulator
MARLVPNPQALIEQLQRLLPHPSRPRTAPGPATEDRILDAALAAFTEDGIKATTMSRIARDAGISREWLYKHYRNRDAVVVAVTQREALRFIDGLAARAFQSDDLADAVMDAFVYAVEFLRDHELLQRVLTSEADVLSPRMILDATPVLGIAIQAGAGYLSALGDVEPERALLAAETIVRLAATITFAPRGSVDLHDPDELRRYARVMIPAILAATPSRSPLPQ